MANKKRVKIIFPVPLNEHTRGMVEPQIPPEMVRPEFEIEFVGSKGLMSLASSYYDMLIMEMIVFEAGLKSEEEGFDCVCINTVSDSALAALRSRLTIPVIGPGQSAFHTAAMLGKKFSIISMWDEWFPMYRKSLREYGLEDKVASLRSINTRPDVQELLAGKEEIVFGKLEEQARKAIDEDGADVIVLGSTTMHQSHKYLSEKLPVPVINPGQIAYKLCEVFLELGLSHSKKAFPTPEKPQDDHIFAPR
ncbi:MAG: aspartate/glutamate racemase family protein [Alphaproteobacteria bacterium]